MTRTSLHLSIHAKPFSSAQFQDFGFLEAKEDIQAPVGLLIERLDALKAKGKPYEYKLFPELGHNTAFSKSQEPVDFAIQWIKTIGGSLKRNYKVKNE